MENAIGIDLGTTFSVIGFFDQEGRCRTIPNSEGDLTTPSVVYFDADQPIVGKEAAKAGAFEPSRCAFLAKRDMGKNHYHREILDQSLPPEVIQAIVLRKLRDDAEVQLGNVRKAVITVPAYFNEPRRKATQDAGRLAGLDVLDIINEPTAAAIAYGVQEGFLDDQGAASSRELILVYDLGGGTFDATLMEIEGSSYRALATGGDVHLGGVDWDRRIADYAADEFRRQHGFDPRNDPTASQELTREAEDAKRALTARTVTTVHITHGGKRMRLELNRDKLKELTDDLNSRTIFTCKKVLTDAKRTWGDVTRVLAVGGSSRMPLVIEALEAESGMTVDRSLAPDEAVAHGAAIYARLKSEGHVAAIANLNVTNVSSHDLGVLGIERVTGMPRRKVLIPRNTPLPARGAGRFVTREDGQADVAVKVIEGGDASGNHSTPIGRFLVEDLPASTKKGSPVVVQFTYQQDGRLDVAASVNGVDGSGTLSVERATGLSDAEIELWTSRIDRNQVVQQPAAAPAAPAETKAEPEEAATPQPAADGPPDPAAAMSAAVGASEDLSDGDLDALLDNDEADLLGEDLDGLVDDLAAMEAPEPAAPATEPKSEATTQPDNTAEAALDDATDDAPAFDGPLFVEQPTVEEEIPDFAAMAESAVKSESPQPAEVKVETKVEAEPQSAPETAPEPEKAAAASSAEAAPAESEPGEGNDFGEPTPADAAPTAEQLGLEEKEKEDVALGSLDFLEAEESAKSGEDDNDLQDFLSSLQ